MAAAPPPLAEIHENKIADRMNFLFIQTIAQDTQRFKDSIVKFL